MPEQNLIDRLDDAVEAMLRRPDAASVPDDRELAALWRVAADLVELPQPSFRARLKADIQRRAAMATATAVDAPSQVSVAAAPFPAAAIESYDAMMQPPKWKPKGFRSLTPYLLVKDAARFVEFAQEAFGAVEAARYNAPDGTIMHGVLQIGDSMLELSDGGPEFPPRPAALHLYVPDVDAVYARASTAGATTIYPLGDRPYGDREADVRDPFGNNWYIATHREGGPVPQGMNTLTPTLHVKGTDRLIGFIKEAFGAEEVLVARGPDGTVRHAQLKLDDSMLELGEAGGLVEPMPCSIHYYVPDVDAAYARALAAGATTIGAPSDRPYGDRAAEVTDPFGNQWYLATHKRT